MRKETDLHHLCLNPEENDHIIEVDSKTHGRIHEILNATFSDHATRREIMYLLLEKIPEDMIVDVLLRAMERVYEKIRAA